MTMDFPEQSPAAADVVLHITLHRGTAGRTENELRILTSLGLARRNSTAIRTNTPSTRGQVKRVLHLVHCEEMAVVDIDGVVKRDRSVRLAHDVLSALAERKPDTLAQITQRQCSASARRRREWSPFPKTPDLHRLNALLASEDVRAVTHALKLLVERDQALPESVLAKLTRFVNASDNFVRETAILILGRSVDANAVSPEEVTNAAAIYFQRRGGTCLCELRLVKNRSGDVIHALVSVSLYVASAFHGLGLRVGNEYSGDVVVVLASNDLDVTIDPIALEFSTAHNPIERLVKISPKRGHFSLTADFLQGGRWLARRRVYNSPQTRT